MIPILPSAPLPDFRHADPRLIEMRGPWQWEGPVGRFQWPSSGFSLRFGRGSAVLTFRDEAPGGAHPIRGANQNHLWIRVDEGPWRTHPLAAGLTEIRVSSRRTVGLVEVRKRTESFMGAVQWLGVSARRVLPPLGRRRLTLDFYGDSDACGYGVDDRRKEDRFAPISQNSELSFAGRAADALGLNLNLIAASGWGVMRGFGGEPDSAIPRVADRTLWDRLAGPKDRRTRPDLVVVMLGDNDFNQGDPGPEFDAAYLAFARRLVERHPGTPLVLCVGTSMTDTPEKQARTRVGAVIDSIRAELGLNLHRFDFPPYQPDAWGFGADWHTSEAGHEVLGRALTDFLRPLLTRR
ncbi:MAG: GDSL-type esterase/lipase family protein [Fimbriimonadaceae bacterium]|nr:GDSL-type esterase/lipase family protein [Fimbriimonadaceae bacterium]